MGNDALAISKPRDQNWVLQPLDQVVLIARVITSDLKAFAFVNLMLYSVNYDRKLQTQPTKSSEWTCLGTAVPVLGIQMHFDPWTTTYCKLTPKNSSPLDKIRY